MDKANALGDYLRARRDLVRPEDIGLIPGGRSHMRHPQVGELFLAR